MNETEPVKPATTIDVGEHVRVFVKTHGRVATTILGGGVLAELGAVIPFAHVNGIFGIGGASYSIAQSGLYGVILLAVPILLGVFPIALKRYAHLTLVAFGAACALFGIFFALWLASSGFVGAMGGGLGGLTVGFYFTLLGYATLVVGYYQMQATHSGATHARD